MLSLLEGFMKKILLAVLLLLNACSSSGKAVDLVKKENDRIKLIKKDASALFGGCVSLLKEEAVNDPILLLVALPFCEKTAREAAFQLSLLTECKRGEFDCLFLTGCIKASFALNGMTETKKDTQDLGSKCTEKLDAVKKEQEKYDLPEE